MKHIKDFDNFLNETMPGSISISTTGGGASRQRTEEKKVEIIQQRFMNPGMAKNLLDAAVDQYGDNYYQFYTVNMNGKNLQFNTISALEAMVGSKEGGDFGLNITGDWTIELFYGPKDEEYGVLDNNKLSAAMKDYSTAYKKAEILWKKDGSKSADDYY